MRIDNETMIRPFKESDMEKVLSIWLDASIEAHDFVARDFWESKVKEMRDIYIPASETYVYDNQGVIYGFASLVENTLAAIFVAPSAQGRGIGKKLMNKAKESRQELHLSVYKENKKSIAFYKKCGFEAVKEQIDEHTGHSELFMVLNRKS